MPSYKNFRGLGAGHLPGTRRKGRAPKLNASLTVKEARAKSMVLTKLEKAACQGRESLVGLAGPRGGHNPSVCLVTLIHFV